MKIERVKDAETIKDGDMLIAHIKTGEVLLCKKAVVLTGEREIVLRKRDNVWFKISMFNAGHSFVTDLYIVTL